MFILWFFVFDLSLALTTLILQQLKENRDELNARIEARHRYIFDRLTMMLGLEMSTIQESFLSSDQVRKIYNASFYSVSFCKS